MTGGICVGVDGGGSGSRARAVAPGGEALAEAEGRPSAIDPGDPAVAARRVEELARRVLRAAGGEPPAAALCAALAGAGRPEAREAAREALSRGGAARAVAVETDAEAAHRDAFGSGGRGILLAAGTGSVALARGSAGTARAGGWGPLLGDEGGGYDLARRGLRAAVRAADGRAPPTALTERLARKAGVEAPPALIEWVGAAGRREIASLAPTVVAAGDGGDPTADRLAAEAAASLVTAVLAARHRCGEPPPSRVALSGGLLVPDGPLRERTAERLDGLGLHVLPGAATALGGACLRARELASGQRSPPR